MSRLNDSQTYNITLENEVSTLLSHFETDFVLDVVDNNIHNRIKFTSIPIANLCGSFEQTFKTLMGQYPVSKEYIMIVRSKTYGEIIDVLCRSHNISFNDANNIDLYNAAYYLYGFLVSDFQNIMTEFLTRLIIREKNNLINEIGFDESIKKPLETGIIHNAKITRDIKIITLSANLDKVMNIISGLNIPLQQIIAETYTNPNVVEYLNSVIADNGDFYRDVYMAQFTNPEYYSILLSGIRLELQAVSTTITKEIV